MRNVLSAVSVGAMILAAPASAAVLMAPEPGVSGVESVLPAQPIAMPSIAHRGDPARVATPSAHADADVAELPEPATWAMIFLGFGGLSFALRRRRPPTARIRFN